MMPRLVEYSSDEEQHDECENKDTDNQDNSKQIIKNSKLPLPSEIKLMYDDSSKDLVDNPEKHCGKIRSFPHERGVWATYVFINYEAVPEFLEMIQDLKDISKKHGIVLNLIEDLHVSLSRTLKLRHHWIQMFIDSLRTRLRHFFQFKIVFQSLEVYENEEKTRTFIGLKANFGYDYLRKITQGVDYCLSEFKLPLFYENPSFHLSCASCVGSKAEEIELFMADLNAVFQSFAESHPICRSLWVKNICCKSGNKLFTITLKSSL